MGTVRWYIHLPLSASYRLSINVIQVEVMMSVVGTLRLLWLLLLLHFTERSNIFMRSVSKSVCQLSQSCQHHTNLTIHSLGCLYTAQLLALLSRKPVVGTRLETSFLLRNVPSVFTLDPFVLILMN